MPELRKLYQGHGSLPKSQGVPEGPQRKNHVVRRAECVLLQFRELH